MKWYRNIWNTIKMNPIRTMGTWY